MNFNSYKITAENSTNPNNSFRGRHSDKARIILIIVALIAIVVGLYFLN